jgi:hypothetical protein
VSNVGGGVFLYISLQNHPATFYFPPEALTVTQSINRSNLFRCSHPGGTAPRTRDLHMHNIRYDMITELRNGKDREGHSRDLI